MRMYASGKRTGVVLVRSCQRAEVVALCKSYNVDMSGKKVDLDPSGYEDRTDLEVLRTFRYWKIVVESILIRDPKYIALEIGCPAG
jgi:hypothetical protein